MELANKYISRNFEVRKSYEAGIVLTGPEVKACKMGQVNFKGAYCAFGDKIASDIVARDNKSIRYKNHPLAVTSSSLFLKKCYIAPYVPAKREQKGYDPYFPRLLLLNHKELFFLRSKINEKGMSIMPIKFYTKNRLIKLEIALVQGLKKYDKREKIKQKEFKKRRQQMTYK